MKNSDLCGSRYSQISFYFPLRNYLSVFRHLHNTGLALRSKLHAISYAPVPYHVIKILRCHLNT
jgi:hypothetical protein